LELPVIFVQVRIRGLVLFHLGFHNFQVSLASSLLKLKCDPKKVQGILGHEDCQNDHATVWQRDQESRLVARGKFFALLLGDKVHLLTETIQ
jgi:hypothetical protein